MPGQNDVPPEPLPSPTSSMPSSATAPPTPDAPRAAPPRAVLVAIFAAREAVGLLVMAVALFGSAGRLDWWPAWAALGVMAGWIAATGFIIVRVQPGLLAERLGVHPGAQRWDVVILSALALGQLARYAVAGLDARYGWTGDVPPAAQLAALALCAAGYALVAWSTAVNAYFSQIVRLQPERGHRVVAGGPYRFVRHPAYVGAIVYELAVAVLLASWPALAIGAGTAVLIVVRTALEDRLLVAGLDGYADYARRVRWRLWPGVW